MYEDILVPTDGSPGMDDVIEHAQSLAEVHDGTIHGLYVVETASLAELPIETSWDGLQASLRQEGENALDEIDNKVTEVPVETAMRQGSPAKDIVEYADEEGCDVIIMGTHGRSGVDRLLLGSVAERVVRSADTPVLTISVTSDGE